MKSAAQGHGPPDYEEVPSDTLFGRLDLSDLSARELGAAVTPLFLLPRRFQKEALAELVRRCERAEADA